MTVRDAMQRRGSLSGALSDAVATPLPSLAASSDTEPKRRASLASYASYSASVDLASLSREGLYHEELERMLAIRQADGASRRQSVTQADGTLEAKRAMQSMADRRSSTATTTNPTELADLDGPIDLAHRQRRRRHRRRRRRARGAETLE